jgi:hypothetical protein
MTVPSISCNWCWLLYRVTFVVLDCALDEDTQGNQTPQQASAHVEVASAQEYRRLLGMRQGLVRERIQALRGRGVNLILCSARCSDLSVFLCLEAGLSLVQAAPVDEVKALCAALSILPVTQATLPALAQADMGTAEFAEEVAIGPHRRGLLLGTGLQVSGYESAAHQAWHAMLRNLRVSTSMDILYP